MPKQNSKSKITQPSRKNWFGRVSHDSDSLIHWSDNWKDTNYFWVDDSFTNFDDYVDAIRTAWDLIHTNPKVHKAFTLLMDAQRHIAIMEQSERDAGEDL